jgi:hypothetical protein
MTMEIFMLKSRRALVESGAYHVKVGEWYEMESELGTHVVIRFDLVDEGPMQRSVVACVDAELTGGKEPSQLYSWISALLFGGKPLPEGYSLRTDSPLLREAWLEIEAFHEGPLHYNRIIRLSPLRDEAGDDARLDQRTGLEMQ